jgi:hypothetical protein
MQFPSIEFTVNHIFYDAFLTNGPDTAKTDYRLEDTPTKTLAKNLQITGNLTYILG